MAGYRLNVFKSTNLGEKEARWWFAGWNDDEEWCRRNNELYVTGFPRRKDALEFLRALTDVDPIPDSLRAPEPEVPVSLTKAAPGRYEVEVDGPGGLSGLLIQEKANGPWRLLADDGEDVFQFHNLAAARREAGGMLRWWAESYRGAM